MKDDFVFSLNDILNDMFRQILKVEEKAIKDNTRQSLSINEMHLLEAIERAEGGRPISGLAPELGISLPSVTVAVNKLLKKGYVSKLRSDKDRRIVLVSLTRKGRKTVAAHGYFHEQMIRSIVSVLTRDEKSALEKGMQKLIEFFRRKGEAGAV